MSLVYHQTRQFSALLIRMWISVIIIIIIIDHYHQHHHHHHHSYHQLFVCLLAVIPYQEFAVQLPLPMLSFVLLQALLCLLIFVLDFGSLWCSHVIIIPFFSFSLILRCAAFSSSFKVYCLSFLSAHDFLWRAILVTDFFSPQWGQIPFGVPEHLVAT